MSAPAGTASLRAAVLAWWEEHEHDTVPTEDDEYNAYDEPPWFVTIALAMDDVKAGTWSKTAPTVEGAYWVRLTPREDPQIVLLTHDSDGGPSWVSKWEMADPKDLSRFGTDELLWFSQRIEEPPT